MKNGIPSSRKNLRIRLAVAAFAVLAAFLVPQVSSSYMLNVFIMGMTTYLCVMSMYVLLGMCGQNSLAQAGLWGVGAYITGNMTIRFGLSPTLSMLTSMAGTALFCFILGFALFRLREYYFTFATIGLMTILNSLFTNWQPVTGGAIGLKGIPKYSIFGIVFNTDIMYYFFYLALCVAAYFLIRLLYQSPLGRSFMAIRDNEIAANCMGINSRLTKSAAFAVSGALCGLAGAMYAFYAGYLSYPNFTYNASTLYLIMIMLGGTISPLGAVIGTFFMVILQEWLKPLQNYMMLLYGIGIIVLMVFQPEGIVGGVKSLYEKYKRSRSAVKA